MSKSSQFVARFIAPAVTPGSSFAVLPVIPDPRPQVVVATHDGKFHCDEALAIGLLRHIPAFAAATIVRTRNPEIIKASDCVVDVGAVYDVTTRRFDHHQKEFQGTMTTTKRTYKTRLSSAGLVYKHFGHSIIAAYADACIKAGRLAPLEDTTAAVECVFDALYKGFIEHIDGGDNGVEPSDGHKNYSVSSSLPSRVGALFPRWNEPTSQELENQMFAEAVALCAREFYEHLDFVLCGWFPGRDIVEGAFKQRSAAHKSGRIMLFNSSAGLPPWKEHLYEVERENSAAGQIAYVLFPDDKKNWRVMCVSEEESSFTNRKSLLFKGLRDDDLNKALGVIDAIFVHASGFIGGCCSLESAVKLAELSLNSTDSA